MVAPPGAGKTTRVPLALRDEPWVQDKKILVLEPRRLAARAAAGRMAQTLGETPGETVGYRVRFGSKISRATRIEVVTEGIFTNLILDLIQLTRKASPRSCSTSFMNARSMPISAWRWLSTCSRTLRDDLRILVMSATLDGARVATLAR